MSRDVDDDVVGDDGWTGTKDRTPEDDRRAKVATISVVE